MAKKSKGQVPKVAKPLQAEKPLTYKQQRFAEEYVRLNGHGTAAAIAAGCTSTSARERASRWLKKINIRRAIDAEREAMKARAGISRNQVIDELVLRAFGDARELFEVRGDEIVLKPKRKMGRNFKLVSGVTISKSSGDQGSSNSVSLKFIDQRAALNDLWEKLGLDKEASTKDRVSFLERLAGLGGKLGREGGSGESTGGE